MVHMINQNQYQHQFKYHETVYVSIKYLENKIAQNFANLSDDPILGTKNPHILPGIPKKEPNNLILSLETKTCQSS